MFESSFRKLGIISQRNHKKVIAIWLILFIVMIPFASLLFSETSYNLTNSIVTSNSMSSIADNLLTTQFASSTGSGNGSSLIIVTNNTPVNNLVDSGSLQSLLGELNSYFNGVKGYAGMTSIYSVENTTLHNVIPGLKQELAGTASLINGTTVLYNGINSTMSFEYGLPALYLYVFNSSYFNTSNSSTYLNFTTSSSYAYDAAYASAISGAPLTTAYVNTFTYYWNLSSASLNPVDSMNHAMNSSVESNSTFMTIASQADALPLMQQIANTTSLHTYLLNLTSSTYSTASSLASYTYSQTPSASGLIVGGLNVSIPHFVESALNLGLTPSSLSIEDLSVALLVNSTVFLMAHNPLITVSSGRLGNLLSFLYSNDANLTISQELADNDFSSYAILPSPYVYHQFVGYDNSTTIIVASFQYNTTIEVTNHVDSITANYTGKIANSKYLVAGSSALDTQLANESLNGMVKALIIGIVLSVIIIGLFFRSPIAAFIPLMIFGFSAVISMGINGLLYKYVLHTSISFITPTLLLILILGLTSDYIVYIMARYRQEMRKNSPEPIPEAAEWAGHAVFTSGITVALSYMVLWLANVPLFSDSGLTNAIGVSISILLANTMLISLLSAFKTKLYWPSKFVGTVKFPFEHTMTKIAHGVLKHKGKIGVIFVAFAIFGVYFYAVTPSSMDVFSLVPNSSGIQALEQVNASFNGDFFDRGYVIMNFTSPLVQNGQYNMSEMNQVTNVESALLKDSAITQVYGPTYPFGYYVNLSSIPALSTENAAVYYQYVNQSLGVQKQYAMVTFQLGQVAWSSNSSNAVNNLPAVINGANGNSSFTYEIGGLTQGFNDAYTYTAQTFANLVPILVAAVFVILIVQLSSLLTPIRLIIMVMASVVVSLALTYILYYNIFGLPILIFLPLFSFITLLAVGLDYDIFMITRAREAVIKGMSNEDAIRTSITENGGVIVTLGLLLFAIFFSLTFSGIGIMEEIGTGLALGVIVDTFISWPFFVPAVMLILKRYNWWPSKIYKEK